MSKKITSRGPFADDGLSVLSSLGIEIRTVIDVGVHFGTPTLMRNFRDSKHILFEPVIEHHKQIRENYKNIDFELFDYAISDKTEAATLRTSSVTTGNAITHSRLVDQPGSNDDRPGMRKIQAYSLDDFFTSHADAPPYLLKIDVDGNEKKVIAGAANILKHTPIIMTEVTIKNMMELLNQLHKMGFRMMDVVDPCYYNKRLCQFDGIFYNSAILTNMDKIITGDFDINQWSIYKRSNIRYRIS
jgi:FkbM family methyltransferase